jgi:hypothetical protein
MSRIHNTDEKLRIRIRNLASKYPPVPVPRNNYYPFNRENYNGTEDDYDDLGEESWEEGEEEAGHRQPSFPAFCTRLGQILRSFGGQLFCKLNWSSPKAGGRAARCGLGTWSIR